MDSVKAASVELYTAECEAIAKRCRLRQIATSATISETELKKLQDKRAKTPAERH